MMPPRGNHWVPVVFEWRYGLYGSLALGLLGIVFAARFGGRLDDIDVRELAREPAPELSPDTSEERTIH
jgi:hypothetical protein